MMDDLTIVTICFERRAFLKRYLEVSKTNGFATIMVDGSNVPYEDGLPSNITYHHMPGESARERLKFATREVKTRYMVLLADDDFIVRSTLLKGIEFLKNNPDYSSVQGRVMTVNELHEKSDLLYKSYKAFDEPACLEDSRPAARLEEHFKKYMFTFYSVQKSDVWKQFFTHVYPRIKDHKTFSMNNPAIFELAQSIHCILNGKNKMFEEVYLVRESIPKVKDNVFTHNLKFNESDIFTDFIRELAKTFNDIYSIPKVDYQILLHDCLAFFAERRRHNIVHGNFNVVGNISQSLQTFSSVAHELQSIHESVVTHRKVIVSMLKEGGVICFPYWYDVNWVNHIAAKFAHLTNLYSDYVLYGAGEHTVNLSKAKGFGKGIRRIADSNNKYWGETVEGLTCIAPSEILKYSRNVIISSQYFETEISQFLIDFYGDDINILTLYS